MSNEPQRVSVCIAAYNGESYLGEQLSSILSQLNLHDECIICDDNSTDKTVEMVNAISDERIRLFTGKRLGHVKNFEKAIKLATGDVIFLSDQDDIWMPEKLKCVMKVFQNTPDVVAVHHALSTIDAGGNTIMVRYNNLNAGLQSKHTCLLRQIMKPEVFGCALAFRRELIDGLLPFPSFTYAHDHWIAITAAIWGRIYCINEPLVKYRQHDLNLTPKRRLPLLKIIKNRVLLIVASCISLSRLIRKTANDI